MTAEIGSLRAVLSASLSEWTADLGKAADEVRSFREKFARQGALAVKAGAVMAAGAAAGWYALSVRAINAADDLGDAAQRIGFTAEQLQEVQFAAKHAGMGIEDTSSSLQKFVKNAAEAAAGNVQTAASFKGLGISVADLRSQSPHEIFMRTADAISRVQDPAQRLRLTLQLFGKSGGGWVNVFQDGAKGLDDMAAKARNLGVVLSNETIAKAGQAADQLDDMNQVLGVGATMIGLAFLPAVRELATTITNPQFLHGVEAVAENVAYLLETITAHKEAFLTFVSGLLGFAAGGPVGGIAGVLLSAAGASKLFMTELDRVNAGIEEHQKLIEDMKNGKVIDTFGQSEESYLATLQKELDVLKARKAFLEGPPAAATNPAPKPAPTLTGLEGADALARSTDAYAKASAQIQKRTAMLVAQGGAEDRTTYAMEKATAAANLQAAAEASARPQTAALATEIDNLADAYARAAVNADVEKVFDEGNKRLDQLKLETGLIGESAVDLEARRFSEEMINELIARRGPLTEGDRARVEAMTESYAVWLQKHEDDLKLWERQVEVMDSVRSGLGDVAMAGLGGFDSLRDAATNFLKQLADMIIQLYIIKPLMESLFGATGTGAGGSVGSLFAGMFADGGRIPAGQWGIVGENGPEAISAGAGGLNVVPNSALGGASGTTIMVDARGADAAAVVRMEQALRRLNASFEIRTVSAVQKAFRKGGAIAGSLR